MPIKRESTKSPQPLKDIPSFPDANTEAYLLPLRDEIIRLGDGIEKKLAFDPAEGGGLVVAAAALVQIAAKLTPEEAIRIGGTYGALSVCTNAERRSAEMRKAPGIVMFRRRPPNPE